MAPRAISTYALCSAAELKRAMGASTTDANSDDVEDTITDCIEFASAEIETFLNRLLVTRGAITEYHTPDGRFPSTLYLTQFPPITITSVSEGFWSGGSWTASDTLTANEDYTNYAAVGQLLRLSSSGSSSWSSGHEAVKVVYTAGYANTAAVPQAIRRVCVALAKRSYSEIRRGQASAQSLSDGMGQVTRFLPAELLQMERAALLPFVRHVTTGRAA